MAWVRTDDHAPLHPKFFRAGCGAYGWWNGALAYCNRNLTDGFIPASDLGLVFPGTPPAAVGEYVEALVRERSLHRVTSGAPIACDGRFCRTHESMRDGYLMHDFDVYQPLRRSVIRTRKVRAIAGRQGGVRSAERRRAQPAATGKQFAAPEVATLLRDPRSNGEAKSNPVPVPVPVPERQESKNGHVVLADDRFIEALKTNPAYQGLDVEREIGKLRAWLLTPRGRGKQFTRQRLVNWLNRAEAPMAASAPAPTRNRNHSPHCDCPRCAAARPS